LAAPASKEARTEQRSQELHLGRNDENGADEPRGGLQTDEYRHADPRDVVEEGGTTMSGPGGAPQEGLSVEERRGLDRSDG
jgi:hypothetical protein